MFTKTQIKALESLKGWKEFFEQPNKYELCAENKKQLLDMAKNGEPKPTVNKHILGRPLSTYVDSKHSDCYDPVFDKEIRKLRPDWFISPSDRVAKNKEKLIKLGIKGEPRPDKTSNLKNALTQYTNKKNRCYDYDFDKQIRKLRPDWFITKYDKANEKKQQLVKLAKSREPRPNKRTHFLGEALVCYTNEKSCSYDPEFDEQIRKLRPDWFTTRLDIIMNKKNQLLKLAKNYKFKPICDIHPLGNFLHIYTNKKNRCYDYDFDKQIRKLRPDWFVTQSDKANEKKKQLLEMAKSGESKLNKYNSLYKCFNHYTNKKSECYDSDFDKQIRKLRPDWFK